MIEHYDLSERHACRLVGLSRDSYRNPPAPDPENAALISSFARYANGIKGSEAFMPADMKDAPEIVIPPDLVDKGRFVKACPPEANELFTRIWTDLQK